MNTLMHFNNFIPRTFILHLMKRFTRKFLETNLLRAAFKRNRSSMSLEPKP